MANSESVKKTYIKKFKVNSNKISVIPCGMDIEYLSNTNVDTMLLEELDIKKSDFVIICVANLHVNKGHRFLLSAYEKFYQTYPNSKLLIAGEGIEKEVLIKQAAMYTSNKSICFLGKRSDVPQLLRVSNVFVLPTFFEGMSNAIMEAMSVGLPIVTTSIFENKELVTDKEDGLLCPVANSDCLYEGLKLLKENPQIATSLGESGALKMKLKYELRNMSDLWEDFYTAHSLH